MKPRDSPVDIEEYVQWKVWIRRADVSASYRIGYLDNPLVLPPGLTHCRSLSRECCTELWRIPMLHNTVIVFTYRGQVSRLNKTTCFGPLTHSCPGFPPALRALVSRISTQVVYKINSSQMTRPRAIKHTSSCVSTWIAIDFHTAYRGTPWMTQLHYDHSTDSKNVYSKSCL